MKSDKKAILIGGGIGIPPMLQLAKELDCEKSVVLGYRDEIFLNEEFEPYAQVYMSSEDGQHGVKGNVIDAIKEYGVDGAVIYACGPTPMLRGIKAYAMEKGIECQISMEEKMACGVATTEDALEMIMVGASAVAVGTANFHNPYATVEIIKGIEEYMKKNSISDIHELIGCVK